MTINTTSSATSDRYVTTTTTPINNIASGEYLSVSNNTTWATNIASNDSICSAWTISYDDLCRKSECPYNKTKEKEKEKKKEEKSMLKNFDFGPCTNDNVRMSMYGLAVKNTAGTWVSYNKDSKQIIDVDVFNFDGRKFLFKMPVAIDQIAVGDIVIHNRCPMFVVSIENGIQVVDVVAGEQKTIMPATNMFGFNFVTKVVSLLDVYSKAPTPDQPFGNLLPMLMMDDNTDNSNMLAYLLMSNGTFDMSNPLLAYAFLGGKDMDNMLPWILMTQNKNTKE